MSLFSVQARKHTAYYDHLVSVSSFRTFDREKSKDKSLGQSGMLGTDSASDDSRSSDKHRPPDRNYAVSAVPKNGSGHQTVHRGRLTLQRRSKGKDKGETFDRTTSDGCQNSTAVPEKRLTLQRRTRTPSMDKPRVSGQQSTPKVLREPNGRTRARSTSRRDDSSRIAVTQTAVQTETKRKAENKTAVQLTSSVTVHIDSQANTFKTPTKRTMFTKIASKRDMFEKLASKNVPTVAAVKFDNLGRPKPKASQAEVIKPLPAPRSGKALEGHQRVSTQERGTTAGKRSNETLVKNSTDVPAPITPLSESSESDLHHGSFKMENSAVTVAVRIRPFNAREKDGKTLQVVFTQGQDTIVQHPVSKQSYTFSYDFSFCSVDDSDPAFASQQVVYEMLAKPLLLRAFEGFNTCLFAYGQTGSGKSYTMMGFEEQAGVIPRFCQELFSKLASMDNDKVKYNVEMSYFEVYNEKIHDLLVTRDEPNQRRMPLRVREHPVHGPYVADLSANVVSSFGDIQGWLELGNKQRATAATGMNDKSSRSHSVFTLVMTQTKTECVEGEEHDHNITSRINLIDLAGSERCNSAQTSGDRLREGASINKSLLTLGKVISALSEQMMTRKKVFIPYRESILTWLLKESLGGNSKTAMIATLSPAGSNVEESLSTLRYAQQARTIINVAKVNEDTSAKLIRELKAEVEKLRAAQMSSQGVEPDRVRLFQQEIFSLKNKLCQQEKEMAEANRAWKEKFEQAESRKKEETKELQKVGVTFKVDNRLPNLVNLNEDPQLSEMLLYMIKEGQTTVGKLRPDSSHDIQLTGTLIADRHCIISHTQHTVSIIPLKDAKTFVNGNLIFESTVLHHGDRVILGGDHYFRFNHPAEVQSGKRASCLTHTGNGHKDFEFAKNELLAAQRAKLEAEIEEAQLKAKEEMMQEIQMAKEVAQKELFDQKALYEEQIRTLEKELLDKQSVVTEVKELKMAKLELEQEVDTQKKRLRLHMEAQAMEEQRVCQAKIVEALEAEKRKISKELEEMQKKRALRENQTTRNAHLPWHSMKLSLMIEEANKISTKLKKHTIFSRHESAEDEGSRQEGPQVRVQNTKLGIFTFWSLEKFQNNMAAMRDLEQGDFTFKDDDVFYDPDGEWEQDIGTSSSSTSSLSRRRSRSLLKSKRLSGRLYEIRVHPIQSLHTGSSRSAGLIGNSTPSSSNSAIPGICKELIGQSLARLRSYTGTEESIADKLILDLTLTYNAIKTICDLYNDLDEDCQDNVFVCSSVAQAELVKTTSTIESAVLVTMQWLASVKPFSGQTYNLAEELKCQVKKMGGFFQMLIQGCESEITSMVVEAQTKSSKCLDAALRTLGQFAVVTGMPLNITKMGAQATHKHSVATCLLKGTNRGIKTLLEQSLMTIKEMLREAQLFNSQNQALQTLKSKTPDLGCALQNYLLWNIKQTDSDQVGSQEEEEASAAYLQKLLPTSNKLYQLSQAIQQLCSHLTTTLKGKDRNSDLGKHREVISSSAKAVDDLVTDLSNLEAVSSPFQPCCPSTISAGEELHCALQALSFLSLSYLGTGERKSSGGSRKGSGSAFLTKEKGDAHTPSKDKINSKIIHSLGPDVPLNGSPHWV